MQTNRLPTGGRIDRQQPLKFIFNGKSYNAYHGDTLASALLANGINLVGRSFKYHRPRGIISSGAEEPNAIIQIGRGATSEPNQKATQIELYDGLQAEVDKGWPSLSFDIAIINDWFSRLFSAGFYYKTFMYPANFWNIYESFIRKASGIGKAPTEKDPDTYSHHNIHCDVLVVGAGPSGLMAAKTAAESGARVIIADEQNEFGGSLLFSKELIDGKSCQKWLAEQTAALNAYREVTCLPRSTVFGYYDYNFLTILERCTNHLGERVSGRDRQRLWRVRAKKVILAQGAFERPLVFCNNDRPGIMLASAVSNYINRYSVLPGKRAVIFTNNDSAYQTALDLSAAGVEALTIIDCRAENLSSDLVKKVNAAGIDIRYKSLITNVKGSSHVKAVEVAMFDETENIVINSEKSLIFCDLIAVSGGWSSSIHLHSQAGGSSIWDEKRCCFIPGDSKQENISIGACNGAWNLNDCFSEAIKAGQSSADYCGFLPITINNPETESLNTNPIHPLWRVPYRKAPEHLPKQFVDYQNDTSVADIHLAVREGFNNIEHVKRYTALGFGTDQGKLGNINGMAILAEKLDKPISEVGTTTFRPAYTPVSFGACAGEDIGSLYDPVRKTALHDCHIERGSPFELVGQWLRPWYFPNSNETLDQAVHRECLASRSSVGLMDASTLGKIDVRGPDALRFLEKIYTHNIASMDINKCAYGIMLGEDGMIKDDGIITRLGPQHFYLTTTTGGAASVFSWLEQWLQTEWTDLKVYLTSMTDQLSSIAVVGPNSRKVIEKLDCDIDLASKSFPFMTMKSGLLMGIPIQIFRVSFSGELAYEINVDSNQASQIWEFLMEVGEEFNIVPYGTESMHVLRAEKGFIIVGQDTDGSVTPLDLGMGWLLSNKKDFLGKRSLSRSDCQRKDRKQLVGLLTLDTKTIIPEGAQLASLETVNGSYVSYGHVTSSYFSPILGHPIALGLFQNGHSSHGREVVAITSDDKKIAAKITSPVFYDQKGERQNA